MKVVYHKDLSRPGNDCWIAEHIVVLEHEGENTYLVTNTVSGWRPDESSYSTADRDKFVGMLYDILFMEQDELETVKNELP